MFRDLFGDTPRVRLLDFLADNLEFDYSISFISEHAKVPRQTLYRLLDILLREGLVKETRKVGRSTMYQINMDSPLVVRMLQLDFAAINEHMDREEARSAALTHPSPAAPRRARRGSTRR